LAGAGSRISRAASLLDLCCLIPRFPFCHHTCCSLKTHDTQQALCQFTSRQSTRLFLLAHVHLWSPHMSWPLPVRFYSFTLFPLFHSCLLYLMVFQLILSPFLLMDLKLFWLYYWALLGLFWTNYPICQIDLCFLLELSPYL
jgi:hypothetical protein